MILIIRGHIRESFNTLDFINLIRSIYKINNNLNIYIHTWNIFSNNKSWRRIESNLTVVTKEIIYNYFQELGHLIKEIIIDDDSKIILIGELEGKIKNCLMPIICWKNYWYGKYKIINYIHNLNINDLIINCRFDVLNNSYSFTHDDIINFINNNKNREFIKNVFIREYECTGIDNIYIGNINTMYKLIYEFYFNLDEIIKNNDTNHPEYLVFRINNDL
jgi:hypothetical protein